ncbi:hypothetical protein POM88_047867 [Heracleum sosnowskyi]|uniref:Uncharacterized protein n=1 Tax=Heracleum sosnowskyi TaxID=360622 RepID=A0AAD8GV62_9APIA|nr:hypothetical protein POM88_047867 [Heracleum sosnowskyi]
MEKTRGDFRHRNKEIVQLISDIGIISMREKENDKKMEVREKIQTHLRRVEEETKRLVSEITEMGSGSVATNDHSEKKLEAEEERNEVHSISSNNEVENEKEIEAADLKDGLKIDGLRRSKRFVKEPVSVEDHVKDTKAKGKGKKRV